MLAQCNIYSCKQVVLFCVLHFQNLHLLCVQLYEQQTAGMEYFLSLVKYNKYITLIWLFCLVGAL